MRWNVPLGTHVSADTAWGCSRASSCFPKRERGVYGRKSPSPLPVLFAQRECATIVYVRLLCGSKL